MSLVSCTLNEPLTNLLHHIRRGPLGLFAVGGCLSAITYGGTADDDTNLIVRPVQSSTRAHQDRAVLAPIERANALVATANRPVQENVSTTLSALGYAEADPAHLEFIYKADSLAHIRLHTMKPRIDLQLNLRSDGTVSMYQETAPSEHASETRIAWFDDAGRPYRLTIVQAEQGMAREITWDKEGLLTGDQVVPIPASIKENQP